MTSKTLPLMDPIADYKRIEQSDVGDSWDIFQIMIEEYHADGRLTKHTPYAVIGCLWNSVSEYVRSTHEDK